MFIHDLFYDFYLLDIISICQFLSYNMVKDTEELSPYHKSVFPTLYTDIM